MTATHLAFDLGAESGRAMLGRFDGERVELEELRRFPTRSARLPDGLYWDALGLYADVRDAIAAAGDVRSVGIDAWGCDFGLLDGDGALLRNPLHHRDGRGATMVDEAFARVPVEEVYETTGLQLLPFNTLFQLLALDLDRAETMLLIPDLLAYWLTGERRAEATNASTTQLLDARAGDWALPLVERMGLPARILAPVVEAGTILGAADGTPLVAVASHDTASAVVAVPGSGAYISSGTWSLVGVELDAPVLTEAARRANLTNERGFGGTTRLLRNVMGLWLVQECRRAWGDLDYAQLAELAATAPAGGPLFDPDRPELLAPGDMPARIAALCGDSDRAVLLRAIFESLACKYRYVLEEIERVTERPSETIHVIGGGARNAFLCRLTADVTRRVVLAGPVEAAALGNVLVQLHAFGDVGSREELRELARRSTAIDVYEPDDDRTWDALYDRFLAVLDSEVLTR